MHGDKASPSGGTRTVSVDGINDEDWYAGTVRETKTFNGPGGPVVSRQTNDPWPSPATATRTVGGDTVTARFQRIATTRAYVSLDAGRGERVTKTTTSFDSYGMATQVDDFGQDGVAGDEQCTATDYTPRNTSIWLMDRAHRVQAYAVKCADIGGALTDADIIGETRTWYDNAAAFETAPTRGLATKTEQMAAWNAGAPTFTTVAKAGYDTNGRLTDAWDAMNGKTSTAYTPAAGGPLTATTVTNPMGHVTTTTLEPAWGLATSTVDPNGKRSDLTYDGLGRLTAVWLPGRNKAIDTANMTFAYLLRTTATTAVTTSRLNADGQYITSYALFDGLLRPRQTQTPSPSGGRLLTDTFYDSAGRMVKTYAAYHDGTAGPGTTLVTATEGAFVPTQTRAVYDGAGRATATIFQPYGAERWRTGTDYAGDRTDTTPPAGGTATSTVVDARGRTTALYQYHGAIPTPTTPGSWDQTSYSYNRKGQLQTVTDPAGNQWSYGYDIRGRQITIDDPDKGLTTNGYDNADRLTSTIDARGTKLVYLYDPLNRKRAVYQNQIGGTPRAQWVYDTIAKGQLSQTTRMLGSTPYQVKVTGYTDTYQPTGTQYVIPTSETGLGGTYNFFHTYNVDGSLASTSLPSTNADLPAETLFYGYNSLGQPTTLDTLYGTTNMSYVPQTVYNALGQLDQITLDVDDLAGGRVWQAYTHELDTGRLTGIRTDRDTATPTTVADLHYSYDNAGNITKLVDTAPTGVDDTQCFGYDQLRRLTQAWTPTTGDCTTTPTTAGLGGPAPYWHSWTHDTTGSRQSQTIHTTTGNTTTTYTPDTTKPHALATATTGSQIQNYQYDLTGNTTCRPEGTTTNTCPTGTGSQTLTWDPEGHLDTTTDATGTTTYIYDADGNRLIRRDPTGRTLYLAGEEIRYTTATGTTTCTRYYSHAGQTIASRTATGLTWLAGDHQGTAHTAIDNATQTAATRRQTPYGTPRGGTPAWPNDKGYIGGTTDNTGLTHLGAREYDPGTGRFISVDPIMNLADPQQWNAYTYANNNPTTTSDPTGQCATADGPGTCFPPTTSGSSSTASGSTTDNGSDYCYGANSISASCDGQRGTDKPSPDAAVLTPSWLFKPPLNRQGCVGMSTTACDHLLGRDVGYGTQLTPFCNYLTPCRAQLAQCPKNLNGPFIGCKNELQSPAPTHDTKGGGLGKFWHKHSAAILAAGGIAVFAICVTATAGVCTVAGVALATVTTVDVVHKLPDNPTKKDLSCAAIDIGVSWGAVAVPGARVPGKAFWDTPWQGYFEGAARQTAALGTGTTTSAACS